MVLELADGTAYTGISFGAPNESICGECVFQTGTSQPFEKRSCVLTWYTQSDRYGWLR